MENGQKTIRALFDGTKIFKIPKYQRAFAWGEKQLREFVDDLENQSTDKDYFLGTILFQEYPELKNGFELIDIVDGQQRITTITIFMKLLLGRLAECGINIQMLEETYLQRFGEFKLQILEQDNAFFQSYILNDNIVAEGYVQTPSQRRLLRAKKYLKCRLVDFSLDKLQEFEHKLSRTRVLTYSVDNTAEATLIFHTTNDRGKGLTNLEKTKSFLMYKTYLAYNQPDTHLDFIQAEFGQIYQDYEVVQELIREDAILQYHYIAFEQWKARPGYKPYRYSVQEVKKRLNKLLKNGDRIEAQKFVQRYTRELRESYSIMKTLLLDRRGFLSNLEALGRTAMFYPLLIKAWKFDNSDAKTYFRRVVRLAEIHAFRVIGIRRMKSNTGQTKLYRFARDFEGDFAALVQALQKMIAGYSSERRFRNNLMRERFYGSVSRRDQRYLFWQYENHLRLTEQPKANAMSYEAFASQDNKTKLTIEHIAPQKPRASKIIEDPTIEPQLTEEFQEQYLHCLGNLTFDPASANASKSNNSVEEKNLRYFRKAPFRAQNELEDFFNPETGKWDVSSIERRRQKIVEFALSYWDPQTI